jgi:hypothetical protein
MEEATRLLNASRSKLSELEEHVGDCERYVRRMLDIATTRRPHLESDERIAREAFVALGELAEVRDRWKAAYAALEQLAATARPPSNSAMP